MKRAILLSLLCLAASLAICQSSQAAPPAEKLTELSTKVNGLQKQIETLKQPESKDIFDKMSTVFGVLGAGLAGILGCWFTNRHNQRQLQLQRETHEQNQRIKRIQTLPQIIDYLSSDDEAKQKAAVIILGCLEDYKFASHMASIFHNKGSVSALQCLVNCCEISHQDREWAAASLNRIAQSWMDDEKTAEVTALVKKSLPLLTERLGSNHQETLLMQSLIAATPRSERIPVPVLSR